MTKYLFIVNPEAGGGRAGKLIPIIEERLKNSGQIYQIKTTSGPTHATEIARTNVDKYQIIVAVGGDGTINEVARPLIEERKGILGIIPAGTGNDLSLSLGIPKDVNKALDLILEEGNTRNIDVCSLNGMPYLNIATIGFDAKVVKMTNTIKKYIKSELSYVISVILNLLSFRKTKIELIIDGQAQQVDSFLLAIGNGRTYGGGIPIMPKAEMDNGYLEICSVKDASNLKVLLLFPSIFKEEHVKHTKYVKIQRAKEVIATTSQDMILNIDGELIEDNKERRLEFRLMDYKLPVKSK